MPSKSDPISTTEDPTLATLRARSAAQAHADLEPVRVKQAELESFRLAARDAMRIKEAFLAQHGETLRTIRTAVAGSTPDSVLAVERARQRVRGILGLFDDDLNQIDLVPRYEAILAALTPADLLDEFLPKSWANAKPRFQEAARRAAGLLAAWADLEDRWKAFGAALQGTAVLGRPPAPNRDLGDVAPRQPAQTHAVRSVTDDGEAA